MKFEGPDRGGWETGETDVDEDCGGAGCHHRGSGKQWAGTTRIDGKYRNPAWSPPREVKHDKPNIPDVIAGGSPHNPMGVAAMTLAGGEYAIHGTNMPGSVGGFVSYGCIRMLNADITDLYQRVSVGTTVTVTR